GMMRIGTRSSSRVQTARLSFTLRWARLSMNGRHGIWSPTTMVVRGHVRENWCRGTKVDVVPCETDPSCYRTEVGLRRPQMRKRVYGTHLRTGARMEEERGRQRSSFLWTAT